MPAKLFHSISGVACSQGIMFSLEQCSCQRLKQTTPKVTIKSPLSITQSVSISGTLSSISVLVCLAGVSSTPVEIVYLLFCTKFSMSMARAMFLRPDFYLSRSRNFSRCVICTNTALYTFVKSSWARSALPLTLFLSDNVQFSLGSKSDSYSTVKSISDYNFTI